MSDKLRSEVTALKPKLLSAHSNACWICGFNFAPILTVHHVVPISEGGGNGFDNLVVLCPTCHALTHKVMQMFRDNIDRGLDEASSGSYAEYSDWAANELQTGRRTQLMEERLWTLASCGKRQTDQWK